MPSKRWYLFNDRNIGRIALMDDVEGQMMKRQDGGDLGYISDIKLAVISSDDVVQQKLRKFKVAKETVLEFVCDEGRKLLSVDYFVHNRNPFSKQFQKCVTGRDFVKTMTTVTDFRSNELSDSDGDSDDDSLPISTSSGELLVSIGKRSASMNHSGNPSKKSKQSSSKQLSTDLDSRIDRKKIGDMTVPVNQCLEPPKERLFRGIDEIFLETLKKNMKADPYGPGIPSVALLCADVRSTEDFEERFKDQYKYEVIGGLHSVTARQQLTSVNHTFANVKASVYAGLTDDEALHLAKRHNINSHLSHEVTHRDYIHACRIRLFRVANKMGDLESTHETPQGTTQWRDECGEYILPKTMSSTNKRNILNVASMPTEVWRLTREVMEAYEEGLTKGQKISTTKLKEGKKPEVKAHMFAPLCNLPSGFQLEVLQSVLDGSLRVNEVKTAAEDYRALEKTKRAFMRTVKCESWEEATHTFPIHTQENRLREFLKLKFDGTSLPSSFIAYCQSAIDGVNVPSTSTTVMFGSFRDITGQKIRQEQENYSGSTLVIAVLEKDFNISTDLLTLVLAAKQVNAITAMQEMFTLAILCSYNQSKEVLSIVENNMDKAVMAFTYCRTMPQAKEPTEPFSLQDKTACLVLGHYHVGQCKCSKVHDNLFQGESSNVVLRDIVRTFSSEGDCVLDITGTSGSDIASAAAEEGRGCVVLCNNQDNISSIRKDFELFTKDH